MNHDIDDQHSPALDPLILEAGGALDQGLLDFPVNIRNVGIIGHYGDGKSTLANILISNFAGLALEQNSANGPEIQGSGGGCSISPRSNIITLSVGAMKDDLADILPGQLEGSKLIINLVDAPGHVDFHFEVSASLRLCDAALVVVDCLEGCCAQTHAVLRQALVERVNPLLVISKIDSAILEPHASRESLYQSFSNIIEGLNETIIAHHDLALGDVRADPSKGTVVFTAGRYGWGFTLHQFARRYAAKFGVDKEKMMKKLWGNNYWDPTAKKWTTKDVNADGQPLERGFNCLVLGPIFKIVDVVRSAVEPDLENMLTRLHIELTPDERKMQGEGLLHAIMCKFLPAMTSLIEPIVIHLPSPLVAQKYRADVLYEGSMDDESVTGIRNCDPKGPLVVFVTGMIPASEGSKFYALGRVFSGAVQPGAKVRVQGPKYLPNHYRRKEDLYITSIESTGQIKTDVVVPIKSCPAGNLVCIGGVDDFLLTSGTITTLEHTHNIKPLRSSTIPVVQVAVAVQHSPDLPKLVEGLKRLSKADSSLRVVVTESGEHVVIGTSDHHLEASIKNLETYCSGASLKISASFVSYRETVKTESRIVALAKSQNKHNRFFLKAQPMKEDLISSIESGEISARDDLRRRVSLLADQHSWDIATAKKIWCFGPEAVGPNILVDATKGVFYISEIKEACTVGFQWATQEGVCVEEPVRGVQYKIIDVMMNGDAIHRGMGQIIPTIRRACYGASLVANPGLQEPVLFVEIRCDAAGTEKVYDCVKQHRGQVLGERQRAAEGRVILTGYLPASESPNFNLKLSEGGNIHISQSAFDHWRTMDESPLEEGSSVVRIVKEIRTRKGLIPEIPPLSTYLDKL